LPAAKGRNSLVRRVQRGRGKNEDTLGGKRRDNSPSITSSKGGKKGGESFVLLIAGEELSQGRRGVMIFPSLQRREGAWLGRG